MFVRLLSRSALGSPMTQYTSHFRGPRAGGEMHVVLVDNGRSERLGMEEFWTSLKCIRCGACMNTCPVYRRSGGLSYGATYSGPIGLIIDPTFNARKYSNLPFASSLNGSCTNVCPVKINIHEQIYAWRRVLVKQHEVPLVKKAAMKAAGALLSRPAAYRAAIAAADTALAHLPRFVIYNGLNAWGKHREVPHPPKQTFHSWYQANRGETEMSSRDEILASIRANLPRVDRPLPHVPLFDDHPPASLLAAFKDSLHRMGGVFLDPPAAGDVLAPVRAKIADAKVVCSTVPEITGNRDIAGVERARGSWRTSISPSSGRRSPSPRPAPSCSASADLACQRGRLSRAAPDRAARSRRHRGQPAPRLSSARVPRDTLRQFPHRPVRHSGHRGCADPRRAGRALAFCPARGESSNQQHRLRQHRLTRRKSAR